MRNRLLYFIVLAGLTACAFQSEIFPSEPITVVKLPSVTPISPAAETLTSIPTTLPTVTNVPTMSLTPLPLVAGVYPIRFSPNRTYIDIVDSISFETVKTYSVTASAGQVMTISVNQGRQGEWIDIPMQIVGADGTVLCPAQANLECEFWRGILPASQDYFITLTPAAEVVDFTLRVVIPPANVGFQTFLHENEYAILTYTDEFAPARFHGADVFKIPPELTLELVDTTSYLNTNLLEAYFLFGSSTDGTLVQTCSQPVSFDRPESILGEKIINGISFVHSQGGGIAAGNIYELTYYRAAFQGVCYEIIFFVHYGNIGSYSPDSGVSEFDRAALMQTFEAVLSTLVIK